MLAAEAAQDCVCHRPHACNTGDAKSQAATSAHNTKITAHDVPRAPAARALGALGWPQPRDEVVFFHLSDKMPDYALHSHFEKYGPVTDVCLHAKDPTCAASSYGVLYDKVSPCGRSLLAQR